MNVQTTPYIERYSNTRKNRLAPLPHDFRSLMEEAYVTCDVFREATVEEEVWWIADRLHGLGLVTEPQADCRYLPTSVLVHDAPGVLTALAALGGSLGQSATTATHLLRSVAFDNSKAVGIHAIIPTASVTPEALAELSRDELAVFEIIARAFVAQFHHDYVYCALAAKIVDGSKTYELTGHHEIARGWKTVYGDSIPAALEALWLTK